MTFYVTIPGDTCGEYWRIIVSHTAMPIHCPVSNYEFLLVLYTVLYGSSRLWFYPFIWNRIYCFDVLLFNIFKCHYLSRTYFSKSASFLKLVSYVTHIIMTKTVTAQGEASNWIPYRKCYQPDWRCNIHSYLQTRLIHLCVEL